MGDDKREEVEDELEKEGLRPGRTGTRWWKRRWTGVKRRGDG